MASTRPMLFLLAIVCGSLIFLGTERLVSAERSKRLILDGEYDINSLAVKISALEQTVSALQRSTGAGSTYVRWGSKMCPSNGSHTVYSGFAGGSHFTESGGAANTLCLSPDPQWGYYEDALNSAAHVYGAEYETCDYHSDCGKHFFGGKATNDEDMACAVCESTRSKQLMIPGRKEWYSGWTKEYSGYLMAGHHTAASATEFICVDENPAVLFGGHSNEEGRVFFFVEGRCGSLKCPPYINGRELTCVVCTK